MQPVTRAAQIIQAKTHTEHIPGWESEDGTLVTSIPSNKYLIIGPLHHLQPHLFQEKGTGASGVVSHLPKDMRCNDDAMLATSPLVQRMPCHLPALRHRWAERSWPGRNGGKRRCWEIRHGKSQQTEPLPSPDLSASWPPANKKYQQLNINSWQRDLVYEMFEML